MFISFGDLSFIAVRTHVGDLCQREYTYDSRARTSEAVHMSGMHWSKDGHAACSGCGKAGVTQMKYVHDTFPVLFCGAVKCK